MALSNDIMLSILSIPIVNVQLANTPKGTDMNMHKRTLAVFLVALMVATVFGIIGTAAGTPHGVNNPQYLKSADGAPLKSSRMAVSVPRVVRSGMKTRRDSKFQYTLSDTSEPQLVNCPYIQWVRFWNGNTTYFLNKPAVLSRLNPATSQWEPIRYNITSMDGYVAFHGLTETKPGTYVYKISCQGYDADPLKVLVTYPIILVNGCLGSEADWTNMEKTLDDAGFVKNRDYFVFTYNGCDDPRNGSKFQTFIDQTKDALYNFSKFDGKEYARNDIKFTIVCHSMGALVTRYYMEVEGGAGNVAQWIGIGPTNHGSALANKIPDSVLSLLSSQLGRPAVLQLRTDSDTAKTLEAHQLAPGVTYRVIVGDNKNNRSGFGSDIATSNEVDQYYLGLPVEIYYTLVKGQTWASPPGCTCTLLPQWEGPRACCYQTLQGDGIVANVQSWIDSADFRSYTGLDHFGLLRDRNVTNYVLACVENPTTKGQKVGLDNFLYPNDPAAPQISSLFTRNGSIKTSQDAFSSPTPT